MLAAVDVHIVGGDPWWHQAIGPALIAATAIAAAWIAARTANRRQQEQLDHDRELQKEQLAYDREQRNRQHARDAIDEAVKGTEEATRAIIDLFTPVTQEAGTAATGRYRPTSQKAWLAKELKKELEELSTAVHDASLEMTSHSLRLRIRLGPEHPIVMKHYAFHDVFRQHHSILKKMMVGSITEDERSKLDESDKLASATLEEFFAACRAWLTDREHEQPVER
jgi:hypothetical protein